MLRCRDPRQFAGHIVRSAVRRQEDAHQHLLHQLSCRRPPGSCGGNDNRFLRGLRSTKSSLSETGLPGDSRFRHPLRYGLDLWSFGDWREEMETDRPLEQLVHTKRYEADPPRDNWRLGVFLTALGLRHGIWEIREFRHMFARFLSRYVASHHA